MVWLLVWWVSRWVAFVVCLVAVVMGLCLLLGLPVGLGFCGYVVLRVCDGFSVGFDCDGWCGIPFWWTGGCGLGGCLGGGRLSDWWLGAAGFCFCCFVLWFVFGFGCDYGVCPMVCRGWIFWCLGLVLWFVSDFLGLMVGEDVVGTYGLGLMVLLGFGFCVICVGFDADVCVDCCGLEVLRGFVRYSFLGGHSGALVGCLVGCLMELGFAFAAECFDLGFWCFILVRV